jgi:TolB-like protein
MRIPHIPLITAFLLAKSFLPAQNLPLIAVIPLRSLGGVSQEQANTVTSLLETGLVKSTMFQVVEKSEIAEVLAAQEYSSEEYMDETFAIRVGKLVSAGQIVLGTLSRLGNRYFLTAKIIDVATGRTLKAEKEEADSLETIASQAEILGYRLAGLQLEKGGRKPDIRFAELLIATEPDGAEVLLNGLSRGTSPLLIDKVPLGPVRIAAKKEGMYGYRELVLERAELLKVKLVLNQRLGRLFIRASERNVFVKLDNDERGFLGDGVFSDIPEGEHVVELTGKGLYGMAQFGITPEQTTTIDVLLDAVGTLHYRIPEGALTVIGGRGLSKTVTGENVIEHVPVGSYTVETSHPNYLTLKEEIQIVQGKTIELFPELTPTPEYRAELERKALEQKHHELTLEKATLEQKLQIETVRSRKLRTASRILYGASGGFAVGAGSSLILYLGAQQRGEASHTMWGGLSLSFGIVGGISAIVGTMVWLEQPDLGGIQAQIDQLEKQLAELNERN